jgi:hypothetical protein
VKEYAARTKSATTKNKTFRKEKVYTDGTVKYGCFSSTGEPDNLGEALDNKNWKGAMEAEFGALIKNKT